MPKEARVFISRIRHDGKIIEPEPATVIHPGDVIAVMTRTELLMARGHRNRPRSGRQGTPRFSPGVPGCGDHQQGPGRKNHPGTGGLGVSPRGLPAEAPAARGADALHPRDAHRPGRRAEPGRRQARRRTGGQGAGICRPADDHDRHDLRGPGHLSRRAGRSAHHHGRRTCRSP